MVVAAICAVGTRYATGEIGKVDRPDDPVGAWKLKCVPPDGKPRECVVTVFREGEALKAHYSADGETRPAKKVVFAEGRLSIEVDGKFAGQAYGLTYHGTPQGNIYQGSARWTFGWASGSFPFNGERLTAEVASTP